MQNKQKQKIPLPDSEAIKIKIFPAQAIPAPVPTNLFAGPAQTGAEGTEGAAGTAGTEGATGTSGAAGGSGFKRGRGLRVKMEQLISRTENLISAAQLGNKTTEVFNELDTNLSVLIDKKKITKKYRDNLMKKLFH